MLLSTIVLTTKETTVELPNSDCCAVLFGQKDLLRFIRDFGDVELVLDKQTSYRTEYSVPAFTDSRKKYSAAKLRDCAKWGCE